MVLTQPIESRQSQRIEVELDSNPCQKRVKICVQNFDEKLGWYPAAALTFPLHQLPLLEQAIADMRAEPAADEPSNIIPFPALLR